MATTKLVIEVPEMVDVGAVLYLMRGTIRHIPIAVRLTREQAARDGGDVSEQAATQAALFMRAWAEARFSERLVFPSNTISAGVQS